MTQYVDPVHLRQVLAQYYNESELRTMTFDLGIDYDSIGGRGKLEKVAGLVAFGLRNGRYDDIAAYVRQTRPFIRLKTTPTPPQPPAAVPGGGSEQTIVVQGDYVGGDKMTGDKTLGDKITVGDISGSSGVAIGSGATATGGSVHTGDNIEMSGDFRGANVNVKATLTNVNQTIGALPNADDDAKAELQRLVARLHETLQQVPADKAEEADAVAQMTETLVEAADSEKPNKMMLQITGEGLKKAAENLAAIVPDVVKIAGAIVTGILGLA